MKRAYTENPVSTQNLCVLHITFTNQKMCLYTNSLECTDNFLSQPVCPIYNNFLLTD